MKKKLIRLKPHKRLKTFLSANLLFVIFCGFIISCEKSNNCYIYITNENDDQFPVDLQVIIDKKVVINGKFMKSKVSNDFRSYNFLLNKGQHELEVRSLTDSLLEKRTFRINEKIYITIISQRKIINNYEFLEPAYKEKTKFMLEQFSLDSISIDKKIGIGISEVYMNSL